mgnify:FL=1
MANRSVFTSENNYTIDSFSTLSSLPADRASEADELHTLMMTINKTSDQTTRMNQLLIELAPYYINPESWNRIGDCIINLETNWMNIYNQFITYTNNKETEFTNFVNTKETDVNNYVDTETTSVTNFVNQKETEMTSMTDSYTDYVNNKETDMTNFVNQKETDVTNFVNDKETSMTSVKDAYIATVNQKELEMQDLDSRTERYWQKWNASSTGQTDYNIFDANGYNTSLPTSATIDIDVQNIDVVINGVRQVPYEDYDKKQDTNGQYTILELKGNAVNQIVIGTEVFIMYYKNVGKLYFKHATTHQAGGRDQITVSEPMLDTNLENKLNNNINTSTTVSTSSFTGQVWFAPI